MTVNVPVLAASAVPAVSLILPVVACLGTVARMVVAEMTLKLAATPANVTFVVPLKPEPVMVTVVPRAPRLGVKDMIDGVPAALGWLAAPLERAATALDGTAPRATAMVSAASAPMNLPRMLRAPFPGMRSDWRGMVSERQGGCKDPVAATQQTLTTSEIPEHQVVLFRKPRNHAHRADHAILARHRMASSERRTHVGLGAIGNRTI
jgi:hypothetical protein